MPCWLIVYTIFFENYLKKLSILLKIWAFLHLCRKYLLQRWVLDLSGFGPVSIGVEAADFFIDKQRQIDILGGHNCAGTIRY